MSDKQRYLWRVILFLYVILCLHFLSQYQVVLEGEDMTPSAQLTMQNNIMFSLFVVTVGTARLYPRFGMFHPSFRSAIDFGVFIVLLLGSPLLILTLLPTLPKTERDILIGLGLFVFTALYSLNNLIFPEIVRRKNYPLGHRLLTLVQRFILQNANVSVNHAWLYLYEYRFESAIDAATDAIELIRPSKKKEKQGEFQFYDWRLISAHEIRMRGHFALAQHELALEDAEIQVRFIPSNPNVYINRSMALRNQGEFGAAAADLDRAEGFPLLPLQKMLVTFSRAHLVSQQGQLDDALDLYQQALATPLTDDQKKVFHAEIYAQTGFIKMRTGHDAEAESAFQQMKAINPSYVHIGLVGLYAKQGNWQAAITEWQQLTALVPQFKQRDVLERSFDEDPALVSLVMQVVDRAEA